METDIEKWPNPVRNRRNTAGSNGRLTLAVRLRATKGLLADGHLRVGMFSLPTTAGVSKQPIGWGGGGSGREETHRSGHSEGQQRARTQRK